RLMIDAVHRYDGYVVQSTDDGIFALFSAPVAHEDHPQRALYAALRIQEELKRCSAKIIADGGSPIQSRVGINTGEVVLTRSRLTWSHRVHSDWAHHQPGRADADHSPSRFDRGYGVRNQQWQHCMALTLAPYIPMAQGFLYLVAVMDWVSRHVLAWRLFNLLEVLHRGVGGSAGQRPPRDLQHTDGAYSPSCALRMCDLALTACIFSNNSAASILIAAPVGQLWTHPMNGSP